MRKLITIIVLFFISLPFQAHSGEGQGWVDVLIVNEELSDTSTDLLGLNHVIPDNAITVNGIDLGVHAKDFISEISSTQSVEVSINRVRYYYNNGNTVVGSEVSINLSDGIFIKAYPRPIVQQEWVPCHPSEPWNCMQVP